MGNFSIHTSQPPLCTAVPVSCHRHTDGRVKKASRITDCWVRVESCLLPAEHTHHLCTSQRLRGVAGSASRSPRPDINRQGGIFSWVKVISLHRFASFSQLLRALCASVRRWLPRAVRIWQEAEMVCVLRPMACAIPWQDGPCLKIRLPETLSCKKMTPKEQWILLNTNRNNTKLEQPNFTSIFKKENAFWVLKLVLL